MVKTSSFSIKLGVWLLTFVVIALCGWVTRVLLENHIKVPSFQWMPSFTDSFLFLCLLWSFVNHHSILPIPALNESLNQAFSIPAYQQFNKCQETSWIFPKTFVTHTLSVPFVWYHLFFKLSSEGKMGLWPFGGHPTRKLIKNITYGCPIKANVQFAVNNTNYFKVANRPYQ